MTHSIDTWAHREISLNLKENKSSVKLKMLHRDLKNGPSKSMLGRRKVKNKHLVNRIWINKNIVIYLY